MWAFLVVYFKTALNKMKIHDDFYVNLSQTKQQGEHNVISHCDINMQNVCFLSC